MRKIHPPFPADLGGDRILPVLRRFRRPPWPYRPNRSPPRSIHQLLPDFSYGDAIGNDVLGIQKVLRSWGLDSEVYAQHVHPKLAGVARPVWEYREVSGSTGCSFSISPSGRRCRNSLGGCRTHKILIYHNNTPNDGICDLRKVI